MNLPKSVDGQTESVRLIAVRNMLVRTQEHRLHMDPHLVGSDSTLALVPW